MATQPDFNSDKYYIITKRKLFVLILINLGLTVFVFAAGVFALWLWFIKLAM